VLAHGGGAEAFEGLWCHLRLLEVVKEYHGVTQGCR